MELLQLHYFRETARLEHMSKAAAALHIAQPSLSQTIKRLEEELKTSLFDRRGRNIVLNQAGTIFLKYVEEIFSSLENASLELMDLKEVTQKQISLCVQSASALLPGLLEQIKQAIPDIRLNIYQNPEVSMLPLMDYIISSSHEKPATPNTSLLLEEAIALALPRTHPLADKESLTCADIAKESFISLGKDSNLSQSIAYYCRRKNLTLSVTTFVDNAGTMRDLLKANLGIAFIPQITWKDFYSRHLVVKTVSDLPMYRCLTLTCSDWRYQTAAVRQCKKLIFQYFDQFSSTTAKSSLPALQ